MSERQKIHAKTTATTSSRDLPVPDPEKNGGAADDPEAD